MEKMKIEIWSDIACPYCYIGKRKMEKALSQFSHTDEIELVWHSYELNPALPKKAGSISYYDYIAKLHESTVDEAKEDLKSLKELAESVGLVYNFDKLVVANTSDALRLIKLAKKKNLADQAEEVFFKAYFTDGKDISDRSTLIALGKEAGLLENDITDLLDSDEFLSEIESDIRHSEDDLDLEYIPFYLFNNKDVIQGSLADEEYLSVLDKAYKDWKANGVSTAKGDRFKGRACSADGVCSLD